VHTVQAILLLPAAVVLHDAGSHESDNWWFVLLLVCRSAGTTPQTYGFSCCAASCVVQPAVKRCSKATVWHLLSTGWHGLQSHWQKS
jgi:hypothetical protein